MGVVDYSFDRPGGAALAKAGVTGAMRYAAVGRTDVNISRSEVEDLHAHGIQVGIVMEQDAGMMLAGEARGRSEAAGALGITRAAGLVDGVVFGAVDEDASLGGDPISTQAISNMNAIASTLTGMALALGGWPAVGAYADYFVIEWLLAHTPCRNFWQPVAWSDGLVHPAAALIQLAPEIAINGAACDQDVVHGDWKPRVPIAPAGGASPSKKLPDGHTLYSASMHLIGSLGVPVDWRAYIRRLYPLANGGQVQQIAGITAKDLRNKAILWYWATGDLPGGARVYFPAFTV